MKKILLILCLVICCLFTISNKVNANEYFYEENIEIIEESLTRSTSTKTAKKLQLIRILQVEYNGL